jgi:hypothetical protein
MGIGTVLDAISRVGIRAEQPGDTIPATRVRPR